MIKPILKKPIEGIRRYHGGPHFHIFHCKVTFRVTIVEAQELLGNFDSALRTYAIGKLRKHGVNVIENVSFANP